MQYELFQLTREEPISLSPDRVLPGNYMVFPDAGYSLNPYKRSSLVDQITANYGRLIKLIVPEEQRLTEKGQAEIIIFLDRLLAQYNLSRNTWLTSGRMIDLKELADYVERVLKRELSKANKSTLIDHLPLHDERPDVENPESQA